MSTKHQTPRSAALIQRAHITVVSIAWKRFRRQNKLRNYPTKKAELLRPLESMKPHHLVSYANLAWKTGPEFLGSIHHHGLKLLVCQVKGIKIESLVCFKRWNCGWCVPGHIGSVTAGRGSRGRHWAALRGVCKVCDYGFALAIWVSRVGRMIQGGAYMNLVIRGRVDRRCQRRLMNSRRFTWLLYW